MINTVFNNDARRMADILTDNDLISTTITSPPYYDMKDYGSDSQIGFGQTYSEYLDDLKCVFHDIYAITKNNGTLWVVIDTFKRDGQVIPLPFDLVSRLVEVGWLLQDIIIWKKDKTVPWSGNGFVQRKFEYVLFFSKSRLFKYYKDRVRIYDTSCLKKWWVKYPERYNPKGKALDEVWEYPIPTQGSWGDKYVRHFCPLPTDMVGTMIQLSTDEGDVILDPFAGSGSVLAQAAYMKRNYIGFELNKSYIEMFESYLETTVDKGIKQYELFNGDNGQGDFESTILNLRALKYAKVIIKAIGVHDDLMVYVERLSESTLKYKLIKVKYVFIGGGHQLDIGERLQGLISKPPLSKYGIEPVFEYAENIPDDAFEKHRLFGYTSSNTYCAQGEVFNFDIDSKIKIISNIFVDLNEEDYE